NEDRGQCGSCYPRPALGKPLRRRFAEPRGSAGNDCHTALDLHSLAGPFSGSPSLALLENGDKGTELPVPAGVIRLLARGLMRATFGTGIAASWRSRSFESDPLPGPSPQRPPRV